MRLRDRVAIVTGAGGHLGRGISLRIAGEGACVVVNDNNVEAAMETAGLIIASGGRSMVQGADVTKMLNHVIFSNYIAILPQSTIVVGQNHHGELNIRDMVRV